MQTFLTLLVLGFTLSPWGIAGDVVTPSSAVDAAEQAFTECLADLPSEFRIQFRDPSRRGRVKLAPRTRAQWQACAARERDRDDALAVDRLTTDLAALSSHAAARREAAVIATALVHGTRMEGEKYRMVGSPLFNNYLIHMGLKEWGFCYHWTEVLLHALPERPMTYFERHWGVANIHKATENNGVVITARGAPLTTGIVYDAWRGAGRPWWRWVKDDHYRWTERFAEVEILAGNITFAR